LSTLGSSLLLPGSVLAQTQQTCNGFLDISYPQLLLPTPPACTAPTGFQCTTVGIAPNQTCSCCVNPGSTVDLQITLGAGSIVGGTNLQVFDFETGLDCRRFLPLPLVDPTCAPDPDGPKIAFTNTFTTTCPSLPNPPGGTIPWIITPLTTPLDFLWTAPLIPPSPPLTGSLHLPPNNPLFCTTDATFPNS